jgi:hypothetical protein
LIVCPNGLKIALYPWFPITHRYGNLQSYDSKANHSRTSFRGEALARRIIFAVFAILIVCGAAFGSCTAPQNQIEAENCLTGSPSSQWTVGGSGDPTIQGFATDMSVNAGQTVNFKISTPASAYTIGIFRLGYYSGVGARKVAAIAPSAKLPQTQPACLTDAITRLFDCGNWAVSASWAIPSNAVSGVYVAVLIRSDTGGASQIFFVVRNDSSASDIVFQTSDESWHAYNGYGGHSLYGPSGFDLTNRAYKVSYNRPFNEIENQAGFLYAEYPMVRWLEANGYDITYLSSVDAARSGSLLQNHKVYLSVGHDEYVSGQKRASVEAARDAGVNLAFFSGNEFFWKTRWENSIDATSTPYRTLVCYKETLGANSNPAATTAVDPQDPPIWTGTWRDLSKSPPADGGRPENALTGQLFRVNGPGTDNTNLSIKIPAAEGKMRFWRNTQVAGQSAGQTWTLPAATLGYEWDVDEDNGARPAGLFDLSTATYPLTSDYLQDFGGLYGAGTATHHLSIYRAASGALVFGAGTVQWPWGLDSWSGGTADANMQQATVNLFADMGVQPATLAGGLFLATKSADTIAPTSQIGAPANGTSVRVGTNINISGTAVDVGGGIVGGVEVSTDGGARWHPATGDENWSYSWNPPASGFYTIQSRATDDSANLEVPSPGITVTATTTAQSLTSLTLSANNATSGSSITGTVALGQPAAAGGVVVTLSSSNTNAAQVPSNVTVPAGQFTATFSVTALSVTLPTSVSISGTYVGTSSASLLVKQALPPAPGTLAIDAVIAADQGASAGSVNSGIFSTAAANELIVAFISTDALSANATVTSIAGAGLTWNLVQRTNSQMGTSEIWRAFAANPLSSVSVTANLSQNVASSMLVLSFAGADLTGSNGSGAVVATGTGNAASGAPTASLTTTRSNSFVLGVGNDWDGAITRTVGANQALLHQYLSPNGDTYWMQMVNAPIPLSGTSVTINDTAPTSDRYNLSTVEVRPAPAGALTISGAITPSGAGTGTTLTLSGTANATSSPDSSGNYSFTNLTNGSYTVTPSKNGVVFTPTSQTVTLNGSNTTANFAAASLQSISVAPVNPTIQAGNSQAFTATGTYTDGSTQNITSQVTWSSATTSVATINGSGLASSIAGGSTVITAAQAPVSGNTTLTVQPTALVITTTSLPSAAQNQAYSTTLTATGGTAPYTWSLANQTTLPPGLGVSAGKITGVPTAAGTFLFTVEVTDASTPQQTVTQALSITIAAAPAFSTIWSSAATPVLADQGPDGSVEIGLKFKSDVSGTISGVRFYKSVANTGTHLGDLWSATGTLLASVTFANETASGWQQVNFSPPVTITANTVYVASYHTTVGHYAEDQNYFANAGVDNAPLHALQDGVSGFDGAYAYGASSTFPNQGFNASNYWLDVVFVPSSTLQSIAVTPVNPSVQAGGTQQFAATGTYTDGSTQNITNQVTWSSSKTAVATINGSGLASALAGGSTSIGAILGSVSGNTVLTVQPATLTITTTALAGAVQNQAYSANLAATGGTPPLTWSLANQTTLPAGLSVSTGGQITGTPTGSGTTTFTVQAADSATTPQVATAVLNIAIAPNACPCTIAGTISGAGGPLAKVTLSGTAAATTTADSAGGYSFKSLANGSYTVTPSLSGFSFNPSSQPVTIAGADPTPVNFTSAAIPPTLSVSPLAISMSATVGGSNPNPASFTVSNTGFGTLTFTATSDSPWLSVNPGTGTAPQAVQASANITGLAVGTYTGHITVSAAGVQGSPATVTVNLTVGSVSSGIVIDATAVKDQNSSATSVTSATFSTKSANELLLAFIATDAKSSGITVTGVTGGGLNWTFVGRTNAQLGTSEIWRAFASTTLTSVSVKATLSQNVTSSMTVMTFTGVDTTGTNGSGGVGNVGSNNGATGAPTLQLTTTRNNSLLIAVGNDWDTATARTLSSGQTLVHQSLSPNGDTYWVQRTTSPVPLGGTTVTVGDTAPTTDRWNLSVVEVRTP